jgi:uncharacterized protein (DUF3820 family)
VRRTSTTSKGGYWPPALTQARTLSSMSTLLRDYTRINESTKQSLPRICTRCKSGRLEISPAEADYAELACSVCGRHIRWLGRALAVDWAQGYTLRCGRFRGRSLGEVPARYLLWLERSESVSHRMRKRAELVLLAIRENGGSVRGSRPTSSDRVSSGVARRAGHGTALVGSHGKASGLSPTASETALSSSCSAQARNASARRIGVLNRDRSTDVEIGGGLHCDRSAGIVGMPSAEEGGAA